MSECVSVSKYRQLGLRSLCGKFSLLLTLLFSPANSVQEFNNRVSSANIDRPVRA